MGQSAKGEQQLKPLESEEIQRILEFFKRGESDEQIAKQFGVPYWAVLLIKSLYG